MKLLEREMIKFMRMCETEMKETGTLIYFQLREVQILSSVRCLRLRRVYFSESNTVKVIFMRIAQVRTIIP